MSFRKLVMQQLIIASIVLALTSEAAFAYIGPGIGAGTVGVILGFLLSILLALIAIVWYPFKRLVKRRREVQIDKRNQEVAQEEQNIQNNLRK